MANNPRRPHPFQISDSMFHVEHRSGWCVVETYWHIGRDREKDEAPAIFYGPFETHAAAEGERARMEGKAP